VVDIRDVSLRSLRSQTGIVAQDTFLFNDTVTANIAYGQPRANPELIRVRRPHNALADEFIERLPSRLPRLPLSEMRGVKLSGGQAAAYRHRARLAAQRSHPDSGRSHLAPRYRIRDAGVQRALANLMSNRTVIVIAHRLSHRSGAPTKIVVLDQGANSGRFGRHDQLVGGGGIYTAFARPAIYRIRCRGGPVSVKSMTGFARVRKTIPRRGNRAER